MSFPFKADYTARQKNKSAWVNTHEFIVLHHTATGVGTLNWNIKTLLGETSRQVSAHYLVDTNWDAYKLWQTSDILWHAWQSSYAWKKDLNKYALGIEVIWPLPWFTDEQRKTVLFLVQHLMAVCWIDKKNVIRHKDITTRKTDIHDDFWNTKFKTFSDYQNKLKPREWV